MKKFFSLLFVNTLLISCQNIKIDNAPWSGIINQSDEKSDAVRKLAQAYQDGNFDLAKEYLLPMELIFSTM